MPKSLFRIVSLLLVPCLVADPVTASGFVLRINHAVPAPTSLPSRFEQEAFALRLSQFFRKNGLNNSTAIKVTGFVATPFGKGAGPQSNNPTPRSRRFLDDNELETVLEPKELGSLVDPIFGHHQVLQASGQRRGGGKESPDKSSHKQGHLSISKLHQLLQQLYAGAQEKIRQTRHGIFLPTPVDDITQVLARLKLRPGTRVADLGSGDGRVVLAAAVHGLDATGMETDPSLMRSARAYERSMRQQGISLPSVRWVQSTFMDQDLSSFDVVFYAAFSTHTEPDLLLKLRRELRPGALVVSLQEQGVFYYLSKLGFEEVPVYKDLPSIRIYKKPLKPTKGSKSHAWLVPLTTVGLLVANGLLSLAHAASAGAEVLPLLKAGLEDSHAHAKLLVAFFAGVVVAMLMRLFASFETVAYKDGRWRTWVKRFLALLEIPFRVWRSIQRGRQIRRLRVQLKGVKTTLARSPDSAAWKSLYDLIKETYETLFEEIYQAVADLLCQYIPSFDSRLLTFGITEEGKPLNTYLSNESLLKIKLYRLRDLVRLHRLGIPLPRFGEVPENFADEIISRISIAGWLHEDTVALLEEADRQGVPAFMPILAKGRYVYAAMVIKGVLQFVIYNIAPVEITYLVPLFSISLLRQHEQASAWSRFSREYSPHPTPAAGVAEWSATLDSKIKTAEILDKARVPVPRWRPIQPSAIPRGLHAFLQETHASEFVVKPDYGSQGDDVSFHTAGNVPQAVREIRRVLRAWGDRVIVQERIHPLTVDVDGRKLDWNIRVFIVLDVDGKPRVTGLLVRAGQGVVNISRGAQVMTFDELTRRLGLAPEQATRLRRSVVKVSLQAYRAIQQHVDQELDEALEAREIPLLFSDQDLVGLDIIVDENLKPYVMEMNDHFAGGIWDLDQVAEPPERHRTSRLWIQRAVYRSEAYNAHKAMTGLVSMNLLSIRAIGLDERFPVNEQPNLPKTHRQINNAHVTTVMRLKSAMTKEAHRLLFQHALTGLLAHGMLSQERLAAPHESTDKLFQNRLLETALILVRPEEADLNAPQFEGAFLASGQLKVSRDRMAYILMPEIYAGMAETIFFGMPVSVIPVPMAKEPIELALPPGFPVATPDGSQNGSQTIHVHVPDYARALSWVAGLEAGHAALDQAMPILIPAKRPREARGEYIGALVQFPDLVSTIIRVRSLMKSNPPAASPSEITRVKEQELANVETTKRVSLFITLISRVMNWVRAFFGKQGGPGSPGVTSESLSPQAVHSADHSQPAAPARISDLLRAA